MKKKGKVKIKNKHIEQFGAIVKGDDSKQQIFQHKLQAKRFWSEDFQMLKEIAASSDYYALKSNPS